MLAGATYNERRERESCGAVSGGEEDAVGRRLEENVAKHKVSHRVTIILQPNEIRTNQKRNSEWSGSNG